MDAWDIGLLALAVLAAIAGLSRLMIGRREELVERFRADMEEQRRRSRAAAPTKTASKERKA